MAEAFIGGLLKAGATTIIVAEPVAKRCAYLKSKFDVEIASDNADAIRGASYGRPADVVVLAVKPQVMKTVALDMAPSIGASNPLIISIAAGIRSGDLSDWLSSGDNPPLAIVRAMPNTPALYAAGATGLFASNVSDAQKQMTMRIFKVVSKQTFWVERETLLDAVTALSGNTTCNSNDSGSGPAYFFFLLESMIAAAEDLGLPSDVARGLAAQTCIGAGIMAMESPDAVDELRRKVTSPNGTTEAALKVMQKSGMKDIVKKAVYSANERSIELGDILSGNSGKL